MVAGVARPSFGVLRAFYRRACSRSRERKCQPRMARAEVWI